MPNLLNLLHVLEDNLNFVTDIFSILRWHLHTFVLLSINDYQSFGFIVSKVVCRAGTHLGGLYEYAWVVDS